LLLEPLLHSARRVCSTAQLAQRTAHTRANHWNEKRSLADIPLSISPNSARLSAGKTASEDSCEKRGHSRAVTIPAHVA
jgi:hypothetical protein